MLIPRAVVRTYSTFVIQAGLFAARFVGGGLAEVEPREDRRCLVARGGAQLAQAGLEVRQLAVIAGRRTAPGAEGEGAGGEHRLRARDFRARLELPAREGLRGRAGEGLPVIGHGFVVARRAVPALEQGEVGGRAVGVEQVPEAHADLVLARGEGRGIRGRDERHPFLQHPLVADAAFPDHRDAIAGERRRGKAEHAPQRNSSQRHGSLRERIASRRWDSSAGIAPHGPGINGCFSVVVGSFRKPQRVTLVAGAEAGIGRGVDPFRPSRDWRMAGVSATARRTARFSMYWRRSRRCDTRLSFAYWSA